MITLWLAALASGCVIPLAPEFEDPEPNYPISVVTSNPPPGSSVTAGQSFSVVLSDLNLSDTLYVRWLIDYPPYSDRSTRQHNEIIPPPTNGSPIRQPQPFTPNCFIHTITRDFTRHQVLLVVSDRAFIPGELAPNNPLDAVPDGAHVVRLSWTLEVDCRSN